MESNENNLYSSKLVLGKNVYFFDVKFAKNGSKYLTITETGNFKEGKSRLIVFENHIETFIGEILKVLKLFRNEEQ